jgi:hypothetical protein
MVDGRLGPQRPVALLRHGHLGLEVSAYRWVWL